MTIKKLLIGILIAGILYPALVHADEKIRIVTTTSTFGSIAEAVAGPHAEIFAIAPPRQNIHFITPNPKDVLKTRKADVFIHGGLDLEIWRQPLLNAAGRKELLSGERSIDVSTGITLLDIPEHLSRLSGDIHAHGNPHYWIDPVNAKAIANNIAAGLAELYPQFADEFRSNAVQFNQALDEKITGWESRLSPFKKTPVVTYHHTFPYLLGRFEFKTVGFLEPKPGIPPTPRHIKETIEMMKERNVKILIKEIFHENRTPKKVSGKTGAAIVTLATETGEIKGDYAELIEHNVTQLEKALKK